MVLISATKAKQAKIRNIYYEEVLIFFFRNMKYDKQYNTWIAEQIPADRHLPSSLKVNTLIADTLRVLDADGLLTLNSCAHLLKLLPKKIDYGEKAVLACK